jgi:ABC-type lipoprotein release transport system permease subunit
MLYGLAPRDVMTMAGAALVLVAVALAAAWLPVRRAVAVDPTVALRVD